jgi:ribulose kinase
MTLAAELYLGLDFGTLSVRALVTDVRGEVVASAAAPYTSGEIVRRAGDSVRFAQPLSPGWALQDPDDWPAGAGDAVRGAVAAGRVDPGSIVGLGLDFTSCTVLPRLADGTPLARADLAASPHAWPKLWKHHGAQRQATELTEVARQRSEPWKDPGSGGGGCPACTPPTPGPRRAGAPPRPRDASPARPDRDNEDAVFVPAGVLELLQDRPR